MKTMAPWKPNPENIRTAEHFAAEEKAKALAGYKAAFDAHLDSVAQQRQYDNRLTIVAYQGSGNPQWSGEAHAFVEWRDDALQHMFAQLAAVEAGTISPPTVAEFVAGLPEIEWPQA